MRLNPLSLSKAQAMSEGQQPTFLRYTNINSQEEQLHQGLKDLGLAEGQHWQLPRQRKVLHSLPQIHGVVAQPCCGSQDRDCELMWPGNCKGVPLEKSFSLLAGKQGSSCHCEDNTKIYTLSEGVLFDHCPSEDDKLVWSYCSKWNSF